MINITLGPGVCSFDVPGWVCSPQKPQARFKSNPTAPNATVGLAPWDGLSQIRVRKQKSSAFSVLFLMSRISWGQCVSSFITLPRFQNPTQRFTSELYGRIRVCVKTESSHESPSTCSFLSVHHSQRVCQADSSVRPDYENRIARLLKQNVKEPPKSRDKKVVHSAASFAKGAFYWME